MASDRGKFLLYFSGLRGVGGYPSDFRVLANAARDFDDRVDQVSSLLQLLKLSRSKPALVHLVGLNDPRTVAAGLLVRTLRIPYVVSTLGQETPFLARRGRRFVKYLICSVYDRVVIAGANGRHIFSSWELRQGLHAPAPVLRLGLPIHDDMGFLVDQDRHQAVPSPYKVAFQFVGRKDIYQKGLDLLIGALTKVAPPDNGAALAAINGVPVATDERALLDRVNGAGLGSTVTVSGPVESINETGARFLVYPSRFDGPPRPVRAALAAGIPVIITDESGMSDDVIRYGAGYTCGADQDSLARVLVAASTATDAQYQRMHEGAEQMALSLAPSVLGRHLVDWYIAVTDSCAERGGRG